MKKVILFLMMLPIQLFGQEVIEMVGQKDSTENVEVKISMSHLAELENAKKMAEEKLKSANKKILEQGIKLKDDSLVIGRMKAQIANLRADSLAYHNKIRGLKEQSLKSDTCLINVASNFIYIPYEAFGVKEIAIPAYQSVFDKGLKEKYKSRYELLVKYKEHVEEFLSFLTEQKSALMSNPFNNKEEASKVINILQTKSFYISYHAFEDWPSTFLGSRIAVIEKQLKEFKGNIQKGNIQNVSFDKITNELQECLKTENDL